MLTNHQNKHNHALVAQFGALELTSGIFEKIKEYRCLTTDAAEVTRKVNSQFDSDFRVSTIRYQLTKIKNDEFGCPTSDANELVGMLKEDEKKRKTFFKKVTDDQNRLRAFCFMTTRMMS